MFLQKSGFIQYMVDVKGYDTEEAKELWADNGGVFDLHVNKTDLDWFRWIFDALDGKKTSWLSMRKE